MRLLMRHRSKRMLIATSSSGANATFGSPFSRVAIIVVTSIFRQQ